MTYKVFPGTPDICRRLMIHRRGAMADRAALVEREQLIDRIRAALDQAGKS